MRPFKFDRSDRLFARDIAVVVITLLALSTLTAHAQPVDDVRAAAQAPQSPTAVNANAAPSPSLPAVSPGVPSSPQSPAASADVPAPLSFSTGRLRNGGVQGGKVDASALPASKQRDAARQALGTGIYVYSADVILYYDEDDDGFFSGLDVLFDVDADFAAVDVYARLYLSYEGGPWQAYFTTDLFRIFGATADDEYIVETELFSDYRRGYYDVLIEIYDVDDYLVASFGPADTSALSVLPLEDAGRDAPYVPTVVHGHGGGGALGPLWLVLLTTLAMLRTLHAARDSQRAHDRAVPVARRSAGADAAARGRPARHGED